LFVEPEMTKEILYTPWRMEYVISQENKVGSCIFCAILNADVEHDRENYLLYRSKTTCALLNIYPYNTGHLMILPHRHVSTLADVPRAAQIEMTILTSHFTDLLSQLMQPDGFNVGMNIGQAAGAGIAGHLHTHVVPRWNGDSNFMTVVGDVRVLPATLHDTYDKIMALLNEQPPEI
jgi:ATP adenylyltransferase